MSADDRSAIEAAAKRAGVTKDTDTGWWRGLDLLAWESCDEWVVALIPGGGGADEWTVHPSELAALESLPPAEDSTALPATGPGHAQHAMTVREVEDTCTRADACDGRRALDHACNGDASGCVIIQHKDGSWHLYQVLHKLRVTHCPWCGRVLS